MEFLSSSLQKKNKKNRRKL
uniref:Ribosomal protein S19 n=1 Tax=Crescentia cujete TaxID=1125401 RepID=A0A1B1W714_9LAMI|nr:ribosomal protein S19 [Crescentia cujete]